MIEIIQDIIEEKLKRNKSPAHASYNEVFSAATRKGMTPEEIKRQLRWMLDNGKITCGRELNTHYIKIKNV